MLRNKSLENEILRKVKSIPSAGILLFPIGHLFLSTGHLSDNMTAPFNHVFSFPNVYVDSTNDCLLLALSV
jgi:hypothetical protein